MAGSCGKLKHGLHTIWEFTCVDKQLSASKDELLLHVIIYLVIWTTRCTIHHIKAYSVLIQRVVMMTFNVTRLSPRHTCAYFPRISEQPQKSWRLKSYKKHVAWPCKFTYDRKMPWQCKITDDRKKPWQCKFTNGRKKPWQYKFTDDRKKPWLCKLTDHKKKEVVKM
jgi:hypothetical protein